MSQQKLFLIPGWAVNASVWNAVQSQLESVFDVHLHDFPGYGNRQHLDGELTLPQLAEDAIEQSPEDAVWLAWSLGTLVAMQASQKKNDRISKLILVCPTPKFLADDGWKLGQTAAAMDNLSNRFEQDYQTALKRFLLLQAGTDADARSLANNTLNEITQHPPPSWATLKSGLKILRKTDLRDSVKNISIPACIILGRSDRVIPAAAGIDLHQRINGSTLVELNAGHAPFIEQPKLFVDAVKNWTGKY